MFTTKTGVLVGLVLITGLTVTLQQSGQSTLLPFDPAGDARTVSLEQTDPMNRRREGREAG